MTDITGTTGNDFLNGTSGDDVIRGLAGADRLNGFDGNDSLDGGDGQDVLDGGTGSDTASYASAGSGVVVDLANAGQQDTLGGGADMLISIENLIGSAFADKFFGSSGDNVIDGGAGADEVNYSAAAAGVTIDLGLTGAQNTVGAGVDTLASIENLVGSAFADILSGNAGNNRLAGGAGIDTLSYAGATAGVSVNLEITAQQDTLGAGRDTAFGFENLTGSAFNDKLSGDAGNNVLDGGAGVDAVSYGAAAAGVTVSLALTGAQATGGAGNDTLTGFENLTGSAFNDLLSGDGGNNVLTGGLGVDTVSYAGATAGVTISLALTVQQDSFGAGRDTLFGFENLLGSAFADRITGDNGNNLLDGGAGIDLVSYGAAATGVTVSLAVAGAQNTGGGGIDTLANFENLTGSGFDDLLAGNSGDNVIAGDVGNDTVTYSAASAGVTVSLASVIQQDTVGAGRDTLFGIENLIGSAFADRITAGTGNNIIDGGAGVDLISYTAATSGVTVSLATAAAQHTGGGGVDTLSNFENLTGSAFDDVLAGNGGDNVIAGGVGSDTVSYAAATAGVTVILATTAQQDTLGAGRDTLFAIENLIGSAFNDRITGENGNNVIDGGAGVDLVSYGAALAGVNVSLAATGAQNTGGGGTDTLANFENLTGSGFDDVLGGDANDNVIAGGAGNDTVTYAAATAGVTVNLATVQQDTFGAGRDTLFAIENLTGSAFADRITGDNGNNLLDGGAGVDLVSYSAATSGVTVSLALAGAQNTGGGGVDTLSRFENLTGSGFDDVLSGDGGDNVIAGGLGVDTVSYAAAAASVTVSLAVTAQQDTLGAGRDTLFAIENLVGSAFNDRITGENGNNVIDGGAGVDLISYAAATAGVTVSLATTAAQNTGGGGIDALTNFENLTGSGFDDVLGGDGGDNVIAGGVGSDTVSYAAAAAGVTVSLASTAQQDTVGAGRDTLFAIENLVGSVLNDRITGENGDNVIDGGAGVDLISYAAATAGVTVSLATAAAQGTGGGGVDTLTNFENLTGSGFDDVLGGDGGDNVIAGGVGSDTVSYAAAAAGVTVSLATTAQQDTLGAGRDTLFAIENLIGSAFNDRITGENGNNAIDGGAGVDLISYALATAGVTVSLATATAQNTGGGGIDTLSNFENLTGSGFDDVLAGNGGDNVIAGGVGSDTVSYADATAGVTVKLEMTTIQDTIGAGQDTLFSIENVVGSDFADRLFGSAGDNFMDGGAGIDTVSYAFATTGVTVDLAVTEVQATGAGNDRLAGFENLAGSAFNDRLSGSLGDNIITGGAGNDTVVYARATKGVTVDLGLAFMQNTVGAGIDTLFGIENIVGSAFADKLTGSADDNIIDGAAGLDFASYATATAGVVVSLAIAGAQNTIGAGSDTLIDIENLTGSAFDDVLAGSAGNNVINGGLGRDTVTYAASTLGVVVNLSLTYAQNTIGAGKDTLGGIENLIGTAFRDKLLGSVGDNVLRGGLGNDLISGNLGNDTASYVGAAVGVTVDLRIVGEQNTVAAGLDTLVGIENLQGSSFADLLIGDGGDNILTGGAEDDVLRGEGGNDTASYADALGGVDIDLTRVGAQVGGLGAGSDVLSDIENLAGSAFDDRLVGDGAANRIEGGDGDDVLIGSAGIDTASYAGAAAGVTVDLALATAQITGGAGSDTLSGFEWLIGSAFDDRLTGDAGDNLIIGGLGDDALVGGLGNDTVSYADAAAAVTVSLAKQFAQNTRGGGIDTLSGFENITGSAFKDVLTGNAGANILNGGARADKLTGGAGADIFIFDTLGLAIDKDIITDFKPVDDTIALSASVFTAFGLGPVAANAFVIGTEATTVDQHLIYNSTTGALFYDADGVGGLAQVQFLQLVARPALTAADFLVIA